MIRIKAGMAPKSLSSAKFDVEDLWSAMEFCHSRGWTDGLPVVPPTEERVLQFLEAAGREPDEALGFYEDRGRTVTVEKVAINAVMAGCLPEHLPVVLAITEAMLAGGMHATNVSTGGAAVGFIVNGPIRNAIGMNYRGDLLGPANRANACIGRAVRLVQKNAMGSVSGAGNVDIAGRPVLDRATLGQPARYVGYHIVENEEDFPQLAPLHVERGFAREQSVVTVFPAYWHVQISAHTERSVEEIIKTMVHYMMGHGKFTATGSCVVILPPEVASYIVQEHWSKADIRNAIYEGTRRSKAWVKQHGYQVGIPVAARGEPVAPGDEEVMYAVAGSPELVFPVVAGGPAGAFIDIIYTYSGSATSKEIRPSGG